MDKRITNYTELVNERRLLQQQIATNKQNMRNAVTGIKNSLKPAGIALGIFGKFFSRKPNSPALMLVTNLLTAMILNKLMKGTVSGFKRKIVALLTANFISHAIGPVIMRFNHFITNKIKPAS